MKQQILHIWTMLKDNQDISSHELNELGILLYEQGYFVEAQVCWQRAYLLNTWDSDILYNIQNNQEIFSVIPLHILCAITSLLLTFCIIKLKKKKQLASAIIIIVFVFLGGLFDISQNTLQGRIQQDSILHSQILGLGESKEVQRGDYAKIIQRYGDELQIELSNGDRVWISSSLFYTFEASSRLKKLKGLIE